MQKLPLVVMSRCLVDLNPDRLQPKRVGFYLTTTALIRPQNRLLFRSFVLLLLTDIRDVLCFASCGLKKQEMICEDLQLNVFPGACTDELMDPPSTTT